MLVWIIYCTEVGVYGVPACNRITTIITADAWSYCMNIIKLNGEEPYCTQQGPRYSPICTEKALLS